MDGGKSFAEGWRDGGAWGLLAQREGGSSSPKRVLQNLRELKGVPVMLLRGLELRDNCLVFREKTVFRDTPLCSKERDDGERSKHKAQKILLHPGGGEGGK